MSLLTKMGHGLGNVIIGAVPNDFQEKAKKRFDWYEPSAAVMAESALEMIGLGILAYNYDLPGFRVIIGESVNFARLALAFEGPMSALGGNYYGNVVLEVGWRVGKSIVDGVSMYRETNKAIKEGRKKIKEHADMVRPGGDDY